jgi:hypothetical protein
MRFKFTIGDLIKTTPFNASYATGIIVKIDVFNEMYFVMWFTTKYMSLGSVTNVSTHVLEAYYRTV